MGVAFLHADVDADLGVERPSLQPQRVGLGGEAQFLLEEGVGANGVGQVEGRGGVVGAIQGQRLVETRLGEGGSAG